MVIQRRTEESAIGHGALVAKPPPRILRWLRLQEGGRRGGCTGLDGKKGGRTRGGIGRATEKCARSKGKEWGTKTPVLGNGSRAE